MKSKLSHCVTPEAYPVNNAGIYPGGKEMGHIKNAVSVSRLGVASTLCRVGESGTDSILVARRETSGQRNDKCTGVAKPRNIFCLKIFVQLHIQIVFVAKNISGLRRFGDLPTPIPRRFTSGYQDRIRSGFRCNNVVMSCAKRGKHHSRLDVAWTLRRAGLSALTLHQL
jgi:hypothetical protein